MMQKMFTIYDSKSESYMNPFYSYTTNSGIRAFTDAVNDPKSDFNRHPADYTLFEIGTFDDQTAKVDLLEAKRPLGSANEFMKT